MKINLLLKNNLFINFTVLFFIITVFLNHIHNSTDKYKKVEENGENYIKVSSLDLKKDFSKQLISDETYYHILDRNCKITGDLHDRHKVRWLKALFLKDIFNTFHQLGEKFPYYINIFLHSFLLFFSYLLLNKTFSLDKKYNLIFLLFITFIFQQYLSEYSYSIFETFFLSLCLYASKNKKVLIFLTSCLLAVLNRESGFLIILSWLIFNQKDFKKVFLFYGIAIITFILVNLDIIDCLLNPKFFIPLESQKGQVNWSDLDNINLLSIGKLIFTNFLLPFGIGFYFLIQTKLKNLILILLFLIYLLVFVFATPLHHMAVRLTILPLIFTAIYFYKLEKIK